MLTLYYAKGTAALAPHILLEELGTPYEARKIDFRENEQRSPDYLSVNPKGRVPALITEHGTLTETPAILYYLAQTHPKADMAPTDPFGLAVAQAFNVYLSATVHINHAHKMRGARWCDDEAAHRAMAAKVPETMTESARMIEEHYLKGPYVLGERYSICDPYLFVIERWMEADGADLSGCPNLRAHFEMMSARPAVQRVMELHGGRR
jgi:glutathione S-transferase